MEYTSWEMGVAARNRLPAARTAATRPGVITHIFRLFGPRKSTERAAPDCLERSLQLTVAYAFLIIWCGACLRARKVGLDFLTDIRFPCRIAYCRDNVCDGMGR